jgi:hypothetical protein
MPRSKWYNYGNGIGTSKTVNGVLHIYALDGIKILRETWNDNNNWRICMKTNMKNRFFIDATMTTVILVAMLLSYLLES